MNQLKHSLPTRILKLMYDSFVLSHISYCITAWGYNLDKIAKLQNKSLRIICKAKYNAHTDPLRKKLNVLKVSDIFELNCLKVYHNTINNKVPHYITSLFENRNTGHNTRHNGLLNFHRTQRVASSKRLKCFLPQLLDKTPNLIKNKLFTHSLQGFSKYFKMFRINMYQSVCTKAHCYVCGRQ